MLVDIIGLVFIKPFSKIYTVVIYIALIFTNLIYLKSNKKFKTILDAFESRPDEVNNKSSKLVILYAVLTIVLIFILAPLRVKI